MPGNVPSIRYSSMAPPPVSSAMGVVGMGATAASQLAKGGKAPSTI